MNPSTLNGQTILVTGAAKRIGRGIALRLAEEGARVAIHYHHSETEARRTADECGGAELFRANLESVPEIDYYLFGQRSPQRRLLRPCHRPTQRRGRQRRHVQDRAPRV